MACSHLFQRVASFLHKQILETFKSSLKEFSSLSESGFIPTLLVLNSQSRKWFPVLISFREWLHSYLMVLKEPCRKQGLMFSSLSESGFIPTNGALRCCCESFRVLISFREWLHSYPEGQLEFRELFSNSSHLFQRVASFLQLLKLIQGVFDRLGVLISFREWLHSYKY